MSEIQEMDQSLKRQICMKQICIFMVILRTEESTYDKVSASNRRNNFATEHFTSLLLFSFNFQNGKQLLQWQNASWNTRIIKEYNCSMAFSLNLDIPIWSKLMPKNCGKNKLWNPEVCFCFHRMLFSLKTAGNPNASLLHSESTVSADFWVSL